jgi:citrate lyase subunit beta-like protein
MQHLQRLSLLRPAAVVVPYGSFVARRLLSTARASTTMHPARRVLFNVPGSDQRKLDKATSELVVDSLVYDLEDGVATNKKADARVNIVNTLQRAASTTTINTVRAERVIRINGIESPEMTRDFDDCVNLAHASIDSILLPKVESLEHVQLIGARLDALEKQTQRRIRILAAIESAKGMINLASICTHPRLAALIVCAHIDTQPISLSLSLSL